MTTDDLLKHGITALKAGRKAEARNLLMQVVEQDERNEMAWLWLSGAVDTDRDRRICLENVLAINPNNEAAKRGLVSLTAKEGVRPLSAVSPPTPTVRPAVTSREQRTQPPADASTPDSIQRKKRKAPPKRKKATKQQRGLIVGIVAGVSAVACITFIGIWWAINDRSLQLGPVTPIAATITQVPPTAIATSTPTPTPTATLIPTSTSTPGPTNTPRPSPTPRPTRKPADERFKEAAEECRPIMEQVTDNAKVIMAWMDNGVLYVQMCPYDRDHQMWEDALDAWNCISDTPVPTDPELKDARVALITGFDFLTDFGITCIGYCDASRADNIDDIVLTLDSLVLYYNMAYAALSAQDWISIE